MVAEIAENGGGGNAAGEDDIQQPVGIHVHECSGTRAVHHGQSLLLKAEPTLVP